MEKEYKKQIALDKDSNKEFLFEQIDAKNYIYQTEKLNAKVEHTPDGFSVMVINDVKYPIDIISKHQNEYELLINGVGYNFTVETPFSLQRKKLLSSQDNESTTIRLKAPMPGKILEVMVKTGDIVKAGDTLLILEAMKMQNAILASTKGIIKKVFAKEGDTTSKSDLLIELEKEV